jgi:hypothetical protein
MFYIIELFNCVVFIINPSHGLSLLRGGEGLVILMTQTAMLRSVCFAGWLQVKDEAKHNPQQADQG